jgi:Butirosin biosynthesis protein H, N-terminal/Domain of unknown function (DUF4872)
MQLIHPSHTPGRHCASTGLQDLTNHHGIAWSEAMCFGLGSGLGIWYLTLPGLDPCPMIHVRSMDIETEFFSRIGHPFAWQRHADPAESESALRRELDAGRPALLQTDIFHLPYYGTDTHYPGHVITAWGYDDRDKIFFVTDTEREPLLDVSFSAMQKARYCPEHLLAIEGNYFAPASISPPPDMPGTIMAAMAENSGRMVHGTPGMQGAEGVAEGIAALKRWQAELPSWKDLEGWQWIARFTYQVIEKRGTGGGGFRYLYADFLEEAETIVPALDGRELPLQMRRAGRAWTDLALALKTVSEEEKPNFTGTEDKLQRVVRLETDYHTEVLGFCGRL